MNKNKTRFYNQIVINIPISDSVTKNLLQKMANNNDHTLSKQTYLIIRNYLNAQKRAS